MATSDTAPAVEVTQDELNDLIGRTVVGDCAECGAFQGGTLTDEDVNLAEDEEIAEWGEPGCVYRFCDECYTPQASILLH